MPRSFICPFCDSTFPLTDDTYYYSMLGFKVHGMGISGSKDLNKPPFKIDGVTLEWIPSNLKTDSIAVIFYKCPACLKTSIKIEGLGEQFSNNYKSFFYPSSKAKNYPDYVPQAIREDYEEAHKIINLSPKASATLSRRCIQGMIRNVFNVNKRTLAEEINSIKDQVDNKLWSGIDAIRKVGNIGAHMEKNINEIIPIEPSEAEKLLLLVELLIKEWYIIPHERDNLLSEIQVISDEKTNKI